MTTNESTTVAFLPHRLNRQPIVVLGLTADELWATAGLSAAIGVVIGTLFAWIARTIAIAPTVMAISMAIGVFLCGGVLRRKKRGRPETWLYRQIQWTIGTRLPPLSRYLDADQLITRSGYWTTRRARTP
jgi:conjugative transfer region protein (TIGR03750 family)